MLNEDRTRSVCFSHQQFIWFFFVFFFLLASLHNRTGNPGTPQLTSTIVMVTAKAKQHDPLCYCSTAMCKDQNKNIKQISLSSYSC